MFIDTSSGGGQPVLTSLSVVSAAVASSVRSVRVVHGLFLLWFFSSADFRQVLSLFFARHVQVTLLWTVPHAVATLFLLAQVGPRSAVGFRV